MNPDQTLINAVNWEHGMLLTPEHFLRQEQYSDAALLWVLRYATNGFGIVGGGARLPETERGAVKHDPIVEVTEDDQSLKVAVSQCRGVTPSGCIVEITPNRPVRREFAKKELEGVSQANIYVIADPLEKEVVDGAVDRFNPQMRTERQPTYTLSLQIHADDTPFAVAVARIKRPQYGSGYEKDSAYIPPATSLVSHSELTAAWRRIREEIIILAERYTELNRAMQEFITLFKERGIDVDLDRDSLVFVNRMVVALQNCIYEVVDPVQSPMFFFGHLRRFFHSAALYLDLSPPVQQYFGTLKDSGETEFVSLIEQQRKWLAVTPKWEIQDDLGVEVRSALQSISGLQRLERAMEGKYIDFRLSPSLEAMNFVFDRGGKVLYKLAAKPNRLQGFAEELTIHFAQLSLEGRDKYRLILAGESNATFEPGTKITVEIRVNEGSGFRRPATHVTHEVRLPNQRNFEFDFDAPDVPRITDLRISVAAHHPIRTALLFTRHRFYAAEPAAVPARQPLPDPVPAPEPLRQEPRETEPRRASRLAPLDQAPPWDKPAERPPEPDPRAPNVRRDRRDDDLDTPPPPRRRRLE
jgi:hypothetical protein